MGVFITLEINTPHINLEIDNIRVLEKEKKEKEEAIEMRRKILEWLSPDDFDETHERHFQKRFNNTGQWLLKDSRFKNWRDEAKSGLLWCYGARKLNYIYIYVCTDINPYCSWLRKNCTCVRHYKFITVTVS